MEIVKAVWSCRFWLVCFRHCFFQFALLVLGILKGLRLVFADDAAGVRWLKAANQDAPFGGGSPLELMAEGGIGGLHEMRRYLDAWRGVK